MARRDRRHGRTGLADVVEKRAVQRHVHISRAHVQPDEHGWRGACRRETDPGKMPPDHGAMPARPQSANVKDDPLVARGEGAMMRPQMLESKRSARCDRRETQNVETLLDSLQPTIAPLSAAKRRAIAAKNIAIDLMVLYTPKVISKYIDVDKDLIALSVEQANQSMLNSGLGKIKLRLVHSQLMDYDKSDGEHLNHLITWSMQRARSRVFASCATRSGPSRALIVDDPSGCGLSTRVHADADEAFVVVHHSCAALTYSSRTRSATSSARDTT